MEKKGTTLLRKEIEKLAGTGELHEFIKLETGNYMIYMNEVCELAHKLMLKELATKGKVFSDEENYTIYERDIFDQYYDLITDTFSI